MGTKDTGASHETPPTEIDPLDVLSEIGSPLPPPAAAPPQAPPSGDTPAPELQDDGKRTPIEHAAATGNLTTLTPNQRVRLGGGYPDQAPVTVPSWQHTAAAQLHGWAEHEHHAGKPIRLSLQDYRLALKSAEDTVTRAVTGKDEKGNDVLSDPLDEAAVAKLNGTKPLVSNYEPHPPALSEHGHNAKTKEA